MAGPGSRALAVILVVSALSACQRGASTPPPPPQPRPPALQPVASNEGAWYGGDAPAGLPAFPFDARPRHDTDLLAEPNEPEEGALPVYAGLVLRVVGPTVMDKGQAWIQVKPDPQSHLYARAAELQRLAPGVLPSEDEAGRALFAQVPESHQAWCRRFTRRVLLPKPRPDGAALIAYSSSADDGCRGYLVVLGRRDGEVRVLGNTRLGPIHTVFVRGSDDLLLDVVASLPTSPARSGMRRLFLDPRDPGLREVLAVDLAVDVLEPRSRRTTSSRVTLGDTAEGLEIRVARAEGRTSLQTGRSIALREVEQAWRFRGGILTPLPSVRAAAARPGGKAAR